MAAMCAGNLWVPVDLGVDRFDPADDDLHSLSRHRLELLRELEDLMSLHHPVFSYVDKLNKDAEEQAASSVGHGQDLYSAGQHTVTLVSREKC